MNDWVSSYLPNRFQATHTDSYISKRSNISCDVPKGSFLGTLLFLININDRHICSDIFLLTAPALCGQKFEITRVYGEQRVNNVTNWRVMNETCTS